MKSHKDFLGEVAEASSLPAQTHNCLSEDSQSPSDLNAIKKHDALCEGDEK